jgi:hypothetical protein
MVRVLFDGSQIRLNSFQTGNGYYVQSGYGSFYSGFPRQRGEGVGNILRGLWRYIRPMAINAGKTLGQEGLATTARVLNNVVQGGNVKESVETEGRQGLSNILDKAQKKLQRGRGYKKKGRRKNKVILKPEDLIGKSVPAESIVSSKKKRSDIFGKY